MKKMLVMFVISFVAVNSHGFSNITNYVGYVPYVNNVIPDYISLGAGFGGDGYTLNYGGSFEWLLANRHGVGVEYRYFEPTVRSGNNNYKSKGQCVNLYTFFNTPKLDRVYLQVRFGVGVGWGRVAGYRVEPTPLIGYGINIPYRLFDNVYVSPHIRWFWAERANIATKRGNYYFDRGFYQDAGIVFIIRMP